MLAPFLGFGPKALDWFRELEADNSKAFFERSRPVERGVAGDRHAPEQAAHVAAARTQGTAKGLS
jgi:hypothetical protein